MVDAGTFTDALGNLNTVSNTFVWTLDTVAPTMIITSSTVSSGATTDQIVVALIFTSSKVTTNFESGDITPSNGSISDFAGSGTGYTATFTTTADGACSVVVDADTFTGPVGNLNTVSNTFAWTLEAGLYTLLNFDGPGSVGTIYNFCDIAGWKRGMCRGGSEVPGYGGSNLQNTYQNPDLSGTTRDDVILSVNNPSTHGDIIIMIFGKTRNYNYGYLQIFSEKEILSFEQIDIFQVYNPAKSVGTDGTGLGLGPGGVDANYDYLTTNTDSPLNMASNLTASGLSAEFLPPGQLANGTGTQEAIIENPNYIWGPNQPPIIKACADDASWLNGYYGYALEISQGVFGSVWWTTEWMYTQNLYMKITMVD